MKKILFSAILLAAFAVSSNAATTLLGTLVTVDNTTSNSTSVAVTSVTVPAQSLLVSHTLLTNTTSLTGYAQVSLDGTNFVDVATYTPSTTAAGTEAVTMAATNITVYLRFSAVTTNNVGVGVVLQ